MISKTNNNSVNHAFSIASCIYSPHVYLALSIMFLAVASIAIYFCVNVVMAQQQIPDSILFGAAVSLIMGTFFGIQCIHKCNKKIIKAPQIIQKPFFSEVILIKDKENQLKRFNNLPDFISETIYTPLECDQFPEDCIPSDAHRIFVENGDYTNGTLINDRLILIQGPHTKRHLEQMRNIVKEKSCKAVVRLGTRDYSTSGGKNVEYLSYTSSDMGVPIYALEDWVDFGNISIEKLHQFIVFLDALGPLLAHCRGGVGRSGTFAIFFEIYLKYKEAKGRAFEIDPIEMVKQLRLKRSMCVQTEEQFLMILNYIDFLNKQSTTGVCK